MKFSIIIPTYNYGHFITECLNSVVAQTYGQWECFIMDNASTDNTEAICRAFLSDQRFTYIKLTENKGPSLARNIALKKATGDYVLFLDADDLIEPAKLNSAQQLISKTSAGLVFSDFHYFYSNSKSFHKGFSFATLFKSGIISPQQIREKLIEGNIFAISCIITKKQILDDVAYFDETISYNEDWDLWLRISFKPVNYVYDAGKQVQTLIRDHGTSHSKDQVAMYLCGLYVCKKNRAFLVGDEKKVFKLKMLSHRYLLAVIILNQYKSGQQTVPEILSKLNHHPLAKGELVFLRKMLPIIPKFMLPLCLFITKVNYVISKKCL